MPQKKPVRSLDSLASLISPADKEKLRIEQEKVEKQYKKTLDVIKGMATDLVKKKLPENEFNAMYDSFRTVKEEWHAGTDKDGDYIIHKKNKYIRTEVASLQQ